MRYYRGTERKGPGMAETIGYDPSQFEWENVHEEAGDQVVFEEIGDTYVGEYLGMRVIEFTDKKTGEPKSFIQLSFRDPSGPKVINAGYELAQIYESIPAHTMTKTMLANKIDVGQASKMNSFRVDQGKAKAGANRSKG